MFYYTIHQFDSLAEAKTLWWELDQAIKLKASLISQYSHDKPFWDSRASEWEKRREELGKILEFLKLLKVSEYA